MKNLGQPFPFPESAQQLSHLLNDPEPVAASVDIKPAFNRPKGLEAQPPVQCQECQEWWQVDPADINCWDCPGCGRLAAYAVQPHVCPRCGRDAMAVRDGHQVRTMCMCHLTPEQRREAERQRRQSERTRETEWLKEVEAQARGAETQEQQASARQCWDRRNQSCHEKKHALPYGFCQHCPRW